MNFATVVQPPATTCAISEVVWKYLDEFVEIGELRNDLKDRVKLGHTKHKQFLVTHDGRCGLIDAYQEMLDAIFYLLKEYLESNNGDIQTYCLIAMSKQVESAEFMRLGLDIKYKKLESGNA